jgi:hypothetical protein
MQTGSGVGKVMRGPARAADLVEVVRTLLLLQGAILIANTLEAGLFGIAFSGGVTPTVLATAAAALIVLVARTRLDAEGAGRRGVVIVEGLIIATLGIDTALAILLTHQSIPIVAVLTRFVLPVGVIALLGAIARAARATATPLDVAA